MEGIARDCIGVGVVYPSCCIALRRGSMSHKVSKDIKRKAQMDRLEILARVVSKRDADAIDDEYRE